MNEYNINMVLIWQYNINMVLIWLYVINYRNIMEKMKNDNFMMGQNGEQGNE